MTEDVIYETPKGWSASAVSTAKNMHAHLAKHYPGYRWGVGVDQKAGQIVVRCLDLPTEYVFFIHPKDVDAEYKIAIRAGGELLEAFAIDRKKLDQDKHSELFASGFKLYPDHNAIPDSNPGVKAIHKHNLAKDALNIVERAVLSASERIARAANE